MGQLMYGTDGSWLQLRRAGGAEVAGSSDLVP